MIKMTGRMSGQAQARGYVDAEDGKRWAWLGLLQLAAVGAVAAVAHFGAHHLVDLLLSQ